MMNHISLVNRNRLDTIKEEVTEIISSLNTERDEEKFGGPADVIESAVDRLIRELVIDQQPIYESKTRASLYSLERADDLVEYFNRIGTDYVYEKIEGYNGPGKQEIGQYHIRVMDYSDGGYVVGYF
tara:strand:+ start:241 stop:621 length:381 start_codon:yes stop_codon:yes gene_type:complete